MSSAAAHFKVLAEQNGLSLKIAFQPPKPDNVTTIYDTGGLPDNVECKFQSPTFMVKVRSTDYQEGYALAMRYRELFVNANRFEADGWAYTSIWLTNDVRPIGQDENKRWEFVVDFACNRNVIIKLPEILYNHFILIGA